MGQRIGQGLQSASRAGKAATLGALLLALAAPCGAPSPASGAAASSRVRDLSPRVVYRQLFRHVIFLERQADLAAQAGKDDRPLRDFHKNRARLTNPEAALLKRISGDGMAEVAAVDQEIAAEIKKFRGLYPGGRLPAGADRPLPPPILRELQSRKDNLILGHI